MSNAVWECAPFCGREGRGGVDVLSRTHLLGKAEGFDTRRDAGEERIRRTDWEDRVRGGVEKVRNRAGERGNYVDLMGLGG